MNRPKAVGTAGETAVTRACHRAGYTKADRRTLTGSSDRGDVLVCEGVIFEVKAGKQTTTIGPGQLDAWMAETETERANARADIAVLITKKKGVGAANAERWDAWMTLETLLGLTTPGPPVDGVPSSLVVRMTLGDVLSLLSLAGYPPEKVP